MFILVLLSFTHAFNEQDKYDPAFKSSQMEI